jgi:hypothetical protein
MKRTISATLLALTAFGAMACSYGAMVTHNDKIYVARNDMFLFGALRKIYECTPAAGSMTCVRVEGAP